MRALTLLAESLRDSNLTACESQGSTYLAYASYFPICLSKWSDCIKMKLFCILLAVVLVVVNAKVITHVPYGDELDVYVLTNPINVDSNNEFPMSDLETAPMLALGFHNKYGCCAVIVSMSQNERAKCYGGI